MQKVNGKYCCLVVNGPRNFIALVVLDKCAILLESSVILKCDKTEQTPTKKKTIESSLKQHHSAFQDKVPKMPAIITN